MHTSLRAVLVLISMCIILHCSIYNSLGVHLDVSQSQSSNFWTWWMVMYYQPCIWGGIEKCKKEITRRGTVFASFSTQTYLARSLVWLGSEKLVKQHLTELCVYCHDGTDNYPIWKNLETNWILIVLSEHKYSCWKFSVESYSWNSVGTAVFLALLNFLYYYHEL